MKTNCGILIWIILFTTCPAITNQAKLDQNLGQNYFRAITKDGKTTINSFFGPTPHPLAVQINPSQQTPSQDRMFKKKIFLLGYLSSFYLNPLFTRGQSMFGFGTTTPAPTPTSAPTPAPAPAPMPNPMPAPAHGGYYHGGGYGDYGGHSGYGGHAGYGSYNGYGGHSNYGEHSYYPKKEETTTTTEATTTTMTTTTTPKPYKHKYEKYEYDYDYYEDDADDRYGCDSYYYDCDHDADHHHKYRKYKK